MSGLAASPEALQLMWGDIARWMAEDLETYGHVHGAGYEGRKGGNRRGAAICKACAGTGWIGRQRCEQCTPTVSDPTGDVAVNMAPVRAQCAEFSERVARMHAMAKGNRRVLRTAEDVLDRGADMETTGAALRRAERRSKDEIGQARDAKARRLVRGERLPGDGGLPRAAESA